MILVVAMMGTSAIAGDGSGAARVYGKIQIVTAFPDYKVRVVKSLADLKVQVVTAFPDKPGKWQMVDAFPDYKVQLVSVGEDFTIQYVDAFPGPTR